MPRKQRKTKGKIPISRYPFTPSAYPGRRPRFSFFFTPKGIYRVKLRTLDRFLAKRKMPTTSERCAILAYGSNACPGQLLEKQKKYGLTNVPVLYGRITGAEAVYAGRVSTRGYVPATLARRNGGRKTWITLLAEDQIDAMDRSEGRPGSYALAVLPDVQFSVGRSRFAPLYAYVNTDRGVLIHNDKPVSLRSGGQKRAKSMIGPRAWSDADKWLTFEVIPDADPPARPSQIVRR